MPYTRKEYISRMPQVRVSKFKLGKAGDFEAVFRLTVKKPALITQEALEAARVAANKILETELGEANYVLRLIPYPHIVLREHKMLTMAGADRLSKGMKKAYGKPTTLAAKIEAGKPVIEVFSSLRSESTVKKSLKTASSKIPVETFIEKGVLRGKSSVDEGESE
jgi:large subunit ribosomal protein L10e